MNYDTLFLTSTLNISTRRVATILDNLGSFSDSHRGGEKALHLVTETQIFILNYLFIPVLAHASVLQ